MKTKQGREAGEARAFLEEAVFPDREVQKFLFLNQFGLKTIFDTMCEEIEAKSDEEEKDPEDSPAASMLKRKLTGRRRTLPSKPTGSRSPASQSDADSPKAGGSQAPTLPPTDPFAGLQSLLRQDSAASGTSLATSRRSKELSPEREKGSRLSRVGENGGKLDETGPISVKMSEADGGSPTKGPLIATSSGQNFTSTFGKGGLKRKTTLAGSPGVKKTLTIKAEFLPKRKRRYEVTYAHLFQHLKGCLPTEYT